MNDDGLKRLRNLATRVADKHGTSDERMLDGAEMNDVDKLYFAVHVAADEIEQLQKQLDFKKTLERQLDRVDEALGWWGTGRGRVESIEKLKAEIERLREVLEEIDELPRAVVWRCSSQCWQTGHHDDQCRPIDKLGDIIKRALKETP